MLCAAPAVADRFNQRLAWKADGNVLEYRVEVQHLAGGKTDVVTTERNYLDVSLEPGKYRYRVTPFDMLGRASQVSDWVDFEIFKANKPEIKYIDEKSAQTEKDGKVALSVDIANITQGSTVELIHETEKGSFDEQDGRVKGQAGNETGRTDTVYFDQVPAGRWRLKVTNPSGLSTESAPFEVPEKPPVVVQGTGGRGADGTLAGEGADGEFADADEADDADEEGRAPAEDDEPLRPYHSITLSAGLGLWFSPYDGRFLENNNVTYFGQELLPALVAQVQFLPLQAGRRGRDHWGFALLQDGTRLFYRSDAYTQAQTCGVLVASVVYHRALASDWLYMAFKAGGGAMLLKTERTYRAESGVNIDIAYNKSARAASGNAGGAAGTNPLFAEGTAFYPCARAGLSLVVVPFTRFSLELGADFTHVFMDDMPTGLVTPYVAVGVRL